jgi:hypothetical protein
MGARWVGSILELLSPYLWRIHFFGGLVLNTIYIGEE